MFGGCDKVNSKSLQVVVGVGKGDDLSLAAVARSGINLPYVQRPPDQSANLLCCLRQGRLVLDNDNFGAVLDVPAPNQCFFPDPATVDYFRVPERPTAGGDAARARNAIAVVENQVLASGALVNFVDF